MGRRRMVGCDLLAYKHYSIGINPMDERPYSAKKAGWQCYLTVTIDRWNDGVTP